MQFYQVLVSTPRFHGSEALTYHSSAPLPLGSVVQVGLRGQPVVGVVWQTVKKPSFTTQPIDRQLVAQALPKPLLQLIDWLGSYYPAPLGALGQLLLPAGLLRKRELPAVADAQTAAAGPALPPLTKQQTAAVSRISRGQGTFWLHGDTGTGKTRVYLELAARTLAQGRSVLLLTPEIGLTPQLEARIRQSLPTPVVVVHSHLTPAQRRQVWLQILQANGPVVVIGPRSALFAPLANLGLIVVDEAHDGAYKQEQAPRYQALRVAARLAQLHQARLVLGSATPPVTELALAEAKGLPVLRLTELPAGKHTSKHITVIDQKDRSQFNRQPHLADQLVAAIEAALKAGQQSLVLLNRRGSARLLLCQSCGWQALCPNCDLPLVYHADQHRLRCHTCGHTAAVPSSCPVCQSTDLVFKGIGTKALAAELAKAFPQATIQRFDADSRKRERLEEHFAAIQAGQVDILVGTQLLAKGLDLPRLRVVGVAAADTSLFFPDYTAAELTYQLLTQVIGRVGRGHQSGQVFIQTYSPKSPVIQAAVAQDWPTFYNAQLAERQQFRFPPFVHTLKLSGSWATASGAERAAQQLANKLRQSAKGVQIVGPAPSFYQKLAGRWQWQIILKAKDRSRLQAVLNGLPAGWTADLDPINLL